LQGSAATDLREVVVVI